MEFKLTVNYFLKVFFCALYFSLLSFFTHAEDLRIIAVNEPPASYLDSQGRVEGYVVDIIEALQIQLNDKTNIEFVPEARTLNIADNKANIIFFSFSRTAFREHNYHWIGLVMKKNWNIFALKDSSLKINQLSDLKTLPLIGVVRGDIREEWLINRKFINLDSVTQHEQNVRRLAMRRLPAIAYEKQGLAYLCKSLNIDINRFKSIYLMNQSDVYIAMSKRGTSAELVKKWQDAFKVITENGTLQNIAYKWQTKVYQQLKMEVSINENILVL
ncbi:MAG: transporter substrate-binding domain-containing protein [Colwellia sp.]